MDEVLRRLRHGDVIGAIEALVNHSIATTRIIHVDTLTPVDATAQPGQGPTPTVLGGAGSAVMGMWFDTSTDQAFRIIKIPSNYVGDASFHVHWSKSSDLNEVGKTVRWRLTYKVFNGVSNGVTTGNSVIEWDDTYEDTGTTTRIVYRTPNMAAAGFVPGYYVGLRLEYVPAGTNLTGGPICVSCDTLMRVTINSDS